MHQCLQVAELVSVIFSFLDEHEYDSFVSRPRRIRRRRETILRAFASLARTCRTLREPAVDRLWREIPDLYVLIKYLMPANLLHCDEDTYTLSFVREPDDAVWKRLDPYIARIRAVGIDTPYIRMPQERSGSPGADALEVGCPEDRGLDPETVLRPLESYLARRASDPDILFPNLVYVDYQGAWRHELYSRLLLHPGLHELHLPTMHYTSRWALRPQPPYLAPHIVWPAFAELRSHVLRAIRRMRSLRATSANTSLLDAETLAHVGCLPTLTAFTVETDRYSGSPHSALDYRPFAALRELLVLMGEAEGPCQFFAHIDPLALDVVTIRYGRIYTDYAEKTAEDVRDCLVGMQHIQGLQCLSVRFSEGMGDTYDERLQPPSSGNHLHGLADCRRFLEPLLSLTSLRTLEICLDVVFQLDDAFLLALAQALPNLETLSLAPALLGGFRFEDPDDPALPYLDGLVPLLESCAGLTTLKLAVHGAFARDRPAREAFGMSLARVRTLDLWTTELDADTPDAEFVHFFVEMFAFVEDVHVLLPLKLSLADGSLRSASVQTPKDPACLRWEGVLGQTASVRRGQPGQETSSELRWSASVI